MSAPKARVIAFYLPQFYTLPENDEWWGKGFTEWTNVGKAKPLFKGHCQPRVPTELGYYDLRLPEVREAQAEMARDAGIEGFMYWHYWFGNGRTILERVFKEVLASGQPAFPFCLGWANHSWTSHSWQSEGRWVKNQILLEQTYPGESDHRKHFYTVLSAFRDDRYITVDGKPLFLVYNPLDIPSVNEFLKLWRELAIKNGLKGIHFVGLASGWTSQYQEILKFGFDAINSSGQWNAESIVRGKYCKLLLNKIRDICGGAMLDRYEYKEIIKHLYVEEDMWENVYPTIIPQWDRSPRSGRRATIYYGSRPELFKRLIDWAVRRIEGKSPQHRILFLKSWNEWAEGNYIEPDMIHGRGYLDALREAIR